MHIPRILIAAPASGSGKTAVTCALLAAYSENTDRRPGKRQRQDRRDLRAAGGVKGVGAPGAGVQMRAGLYRPHVPPGSGRSGFEKSGPLLQRERRDPG